MRPNWAYCHSGSITTDNIIRHSRDGGNLYVEVSFGRIVYLAMDPRSGRG